jgi:hypothetical protein
MCRPFLVHSFEDFLSCNVKLNDSCPLEKMMSGYSADREFCCFNQGLLKITLLETC